MKILDMSAGWRHIWHNKEKVLPLLRGWEPLFAHGLNIPGRHKSQTYWVMLRRMDFPPVPHV